MWATRRVGRGVPRGRDRESWGKENARAWRGAGGGGAGGRTLSPSHRPSPDVAHAGCTFHARSLISARLRQFGEIGEIGGIGVVVKVGGARGRPATRPMGAVRVLSRDARAGARATTRAREQRREGGKRRGEAVERRGAAPHLPRDLVGRERVGQVDLVRKDEHDREPAPRRARESAGAANGSRRNVRADLRRDLWI